MEGSDKLKEVHDVKVSLEFSYAAIQEEIALTRLTLLEVAALAQAEAFKVVAEGLACVICEPALVEDQMEDIVQLLAFGLLADHFATL